jgi:gas vesicle protein
VENNKSNNNFFGGFLFGVLIGAAIVFLLGTEKGKKILKTISENGMDNLDNLLEKAGKATDLDEVYEEEEDEIIPETKVIARESVEEKPKTRRFFRGISKHLN